MQRARDTRAAEDLVHVLPLLCVPTTPQTATHRQQVLRDTHGCTLPVQVAWHSAREMDNATLAALDQRFGPVLGLDVAALPYPAHHRP